MVGHVIYSLPEPVEDLQFRWEAVGGSPELTDLFAAQYGSELSYLFKSPPGALTFQQLAQDRVAIE